MYFFKNFKPSFKELRVLVQRRKKFEISIANTLLLRCFQSQENKPVYVKNISETSKEIAISYYDFFRNEAYLYMPTSWIRKKFTRTDSHKNIRKALYILLRRNSICVHK